MIKKLDAVFANDDIIFVNEDFGNVTFSNDKMGILYKINLDDLNFDVDDPEILFMPGSPANKLCNNYIFFRHFLVANRRN